MNPIKHIDPMGSIFVPLMTALIPPHFVFGWAKPVPYNAYNLRDQKWGDSKVALAGPFTNLGIALVFAIFLRIGADYLTGPAFSIIDLIIQINIVLAVFNLVPIPPLDGSKVLLNALPLRYRYVGDYLERYSLLLILFLVFFLWKLFMPIVQFIYGLLVG